MCACMCVHALMIIIIKIIIPYFIQIRHTDDFPSTGSRLVNNNVCIRNESTESDMYCIVKLTALQLIHQRCYSLPIQIGAT